MVGGLLRQAREEVGLSIEELSVTSGIEVSRIQAYETGDQGIPVHELSVLASGVNKNLNYFEESSGQIGELLAMREAWQHFADLPEDVS